jgi:hypothetical protein
MTKITKLAARIHAKASERYIDVIFKYDDGSKLDTSVPIEYRRTGTDVPDNEVDDYLERVRTEADPAQWAKWKAEQISFWADKPGAGVTKSFFDVLTKGFKWSCATCTLPNNPNFARRIQDLKQFGYTIATNTNRPCPSCAKNTTQLIMLPIRRGGLTGYETWTPALRARIILLLRAFDAFEAKVTRKEGLLPDHKFPEIRWDAETKRDTLENLTDVDIKRDFQLLSNQRNQQKREVCRTCFQTGARGTVYGIDFFYKGKSTWDPSISKQGKQAEQGCIGCGWYDINTWRAELLKKIH